MQTRLIAACAQVRHELHVFRQEYLPVFLALTPEEIWADSSAAKIPDASTWTYPPPLHAWQRAVEELAVSLPTDNSAPNCRPFHPLDYEKFSSKPFFPGFQPNDPENCLRWVNDNLVWKLNPDSLACLAGFLPEESKIAIVDINNAESWLPQVKGWLMQLPPDSSLFYNSLCSVLPYVAYFDPAFAKLALNQMTWKTIVEKDPNISAERRRQLLENLDCGIIFTQVLNNALLHVFTAMAGNHFLVIRDLLDHPSVQGGYTHLMPNYLFAVLLAKIGVLHRLLAVTC